MPVLKALRRSTAQSFATGEPWAGRLDLRLLRQMFGRAALGDPAAPRGLPFEIGTALQPIIDLSTGTVAAVEALARFSGADGRVAFPVEETFAAAHAAGRGHDLEAACLRAALTRRQDLPADVFLSVNVSPDALGHPAVQAALAGDLAGVIVEVTEHAASEPHQLVDSLLRLRRSGAAVAVDDASKGHSGLHRLAAIRPDIVKLDRTLVSGVRDSVEHTAVIEAIVSLCRRLNSSLLGEGVESLDDLAALAELDVDYGQGLAIGPPQLDYTPPAREITLACHAIRLELMRGRPASLGSFGGDGLRGVTAALVGTSAQDDLYSALSAAAVELKLDSIGLTVLGRDQFVSEVTAVGTDPEHGRHPLDDMPITQQALRSGRVIEAHLDDPDLTPEARATLLRRGMTAMLVAPLIADGIPLGVLHLGQRQATRWRTRHILQVRSLADHVALVLLRLRAPAGEVRIPVGSGSA